jgi:hypothetical protein
MNVGWITFKRSELKAVVRLAGRIENGAARFLVLDRGRVIRGWGGGDRGFGQTAEHAATTESLHSHPPEGPLLASRPPGAAICRETKNRQRPLPQPDRKPHALSPTEERELPNSPKRRRGTICCCDLGLSSSATKSRVIKSCRV